MHGRPRYRLSCHVSPSVARQALCLVLGHRWTPVDSTSFRYCKRCNSNGWAL